MLARWLVTLVFCAQAGPSVTPKKPTPKELAERIEAETPRVVERTAAIEKELAALNGHPWAGNYGRPNGMSVDVLRLAPSSGATHTASGCLGIERCNHGTIVRSGPDWVEIAWVLDPAWNTARDLGRDRPVLATKLRVIPWGEARWLVPEPRLVEFCNAVNARDAIRLHGFWRKDSMSFLVGDVPAGKPTVPEELRPFLLEAPITCAVLDSRRSDPPSKLDPAKPFRVLTVDAGAKQGLRAGKLLYGNVEPIAGEVASTTDTTATVEFREVGGDERRAALANGAVLSTRKPEVR